jgi:hypothetical protein
VNYGTQPRRAGLCVMEFVFRQQDMIKRNPYILHKLRKREDVNKVTLQIKTAESTFLVFIVVPDEERGAKFRNYMF